MGTRRTFLRQMLCMAGAGALAWAAGIARVVAGAAKTILPRGTPLESLRNRNPAELDTSNLSVTPLDDFQTMGLTDHRVNLENWRLEIAGSVAAPLRLTYQELLALPGLERAVLLICPGVFVQHGLWAGFSLGPLLVRAGVKGNVSRITVQGPLGRYVKTASFPLEDVRSGRVFLCHHVNGEPLPVKHGYPLRVVAEGYYGYDWIKYASRIRVE
ncbi:MAG: molybdopterin-dependent oxidoreductase [Deltaproteobacteria bacterium]|nr:molybdopterin-dependent oxidoreductase [Deltaproteobacteria bacterium]